MLISKLKFGRLGIGLMLSVSLLLSAAGQSFAQTGTQTGATDRQVNDNLRMLQNQMSTFRYDLEDAITAHPVSYRGDDINQSLEELEGAIGTFTKDFRVKRETSEGVNKILQEAQDVDEFMRATNLRGNVMRDWSNVRTTLDQLALNYKVFWSWNDGTGPSGPNNSGSNTGTNGGYSTSQPVYQQNTRTSVGLGGVYRLDASASDDAHDVAARAVLIINSRDRERMKADLEEKLAAPDSLTLDIRGQQVTITSSKGQFNFVADGADKYEQGDGGKNIRVRATLRNDRLTINRTGEGDDDYTAIFESIDAGAHMRVTRRVNYPSLSQTVIAESMYNKTSDVGQSGSPKGPVDDPGSWSDSNPAGGTGGGNSGNNGNNGGNNYPSQYPSTTNGRQGDFIVPNGVTLTARLDNEITTKASQNNDRFKMTVTAPDEFRGAVIEGYISGVKRSGKVNGRAEITFNFERIKLRSGESYEFAGYLQSITNTLGETVKVDTEGVAKGDSQTKETAKRGGVGAAIGAVIGGVLGGVKGAVIGATIGGAGGAGSVYVQGKDDLELKPGSTVVLQSSAPRDGGR
jgi:hypothetical protein